ncbi:transporter substrate-binding domain-containing protein [Paralcaligenes ureilyticus]|uniref:Amino acid ABC transporter substrate-binding protein (PAAT family) n=1 Tax=Paralcaligenes ureilyticus TaxID=627131 RepID=A0A4R3M8D4_9BURK|nr:transporter substrate-binding domain-containing protein [Paralcaligenes ureilyticus]TCT09774.1 amino acid ABC transporter substrate-binding protein (PAAT family) [Paralcaligenes ureilyticus]
MKVDINKTGMKKAVSRILGFGVLAAALGVASVPAQANDLSVIKANKVIRIALDLGTPPFGTKDATMKPIGSDVETAELLAKDLGVKMELVPTTGANRVPFLLTNKADLVVASFSITPERQKVVDFSVPYAAIQAVVGAPKSMNIKTLKDLVGKTVISTRGTTNDQAITKQALPGTHILRFDDDATSITAVISGQGDIFATAPALLQGINQKDPKKQMETKIVLSQAMLGVGLAKGNTELKAWVDNWVRANLKNGKLNAIYQKYHGAPLPESVTSAGK